MTYYLSIIWDYFIWDVIFISAHVITFPFILLFAALIILSGIKLKSKSLSIAGFIYIIVQFFWFAYTIITRLISVYGRWEFLSDGGNLGGW